MKQTESNLSTNSELKKLTEEKNWQEILNLTNGLATIDANTKFFVANAYKELSNFELSLENVEEGLTQQPNSSWGIILKYQTLKKLNRIDEAISFASKKIFESNIDNYSLTSDLIKDLIEKDDFDSAVNINEKRDVFKDKVEKKICICIQSFNKADTLEKLLDSIVKCKDTENFSIIIIQDSWIGSKNESKYKIGFDEVTAVISRHVSTLSECFHNVEIIKNKKNLGTATTCRKLLDYVSSKYDAFAFFEDDCVLADDCLNWINFCVSSAISEYGAHFATCESVFFDYGKKEKPTESKIEELIEISKKLSKYYCKLSFVPSTSFITTSKIWQSYNKIRSFPRGPESLNSYYKKHSQKTIFPIVARAIDIGMEHESGYSIANLGKGNVKEIKNSYAMAKDYGDIRYLEYSENLDLLFSATSNIEEKSIMKLTKIFEI
ncbi:glycosyltransferase family 2 protein [Alishewanella tabrizica]|uniref:Glycosyltransferase 2-like domain-containing protein n=1 Tax=Alishewanella tabrizica TaxID=671278 RepID=A0ABQ2WBB8_9ALTE|nr:glycosyltransferase family 2 protein [Alishewanella tabrizica]GGW48420.1 hypothetical protein GCM10008111_00010 [Alishewanella tabrizica]